MNNQIIVAMDNEIPDGIKLISELKTSKEVYGYKVGSLWIMERGIRILNTISDILHQANSEQVIILDMQKWATDIPEIVQKQVLKVVLHVDELIGCPMGGGRQSLKAFAETCINNGVDPICVLEMTHPDSGAYLHGLAYMDILHDALSFGIRRFVIPATKEPKSEIKQVLMHQYGDYADNVKFYATGFKVQGGQTKPMVDFRVEKFIVGRAIYEAPDPIHAVREIYQEINKGKE